MCRLRNGPFTIALCLTGPLAGANIATKWKEHDYEFSMAGTTIRPKKRVLFPFGSEILKNRNG
jgi:hypothetical protein